MKQVYRALNQYFQDNLDQRGLFYIKKSTKLILSETNHQVFQCKDEQVFEEIYQEPFSLIQLISSKRLYFEESLDVFKED